MFLALFSVERSLGDCGPANAGLHGRNLGCEDDVVGEDTSPAEHRQRRARAHAALLQGFEISKTGQIQP